MPSGWPFWVVRLTDSRERCQQYPARFEYPKERAGGCRNVKDQLERLGQNDAIEGVVRYLRSIC